MEIGEQLPDGQYAVDVTVMVDGYKESFLGDFTTFPLKAIEIKGRFAASLEDDAGLWLGFAVWIMDNGSGFRFVQHGIKEDDAHGMNDHWQEMIKYWEETQASSAVTADPFGGINLDPRLLDLQIRRDGNGVPLPLPLQPIETMHIDGFLPVIINIVPITNLPLLLGLAPSPSTRPSALLRASGEPSRTTSEGLQPGSVRVEGLDLPAQKQEPVQLTYQELSLVVTPAGERLYARDPEEISYL